MVRKTGGRQIHVPQPLSPHEVFYKLVHGVADQRWEELPNLYAEKTQVEHPIDPLGEPPLRTRDELRKHFTAGGPSESNVRFVPANITIHDTTDPEVIIAEFEYHGTVRETGEAFTVPCIFVLRVRNGEIVASRDYIDPLSLPRALGQLDELFTAMKKA